MLQWWPGLSVRSDLPCATDRVTTLGATVIRRNGAPDRVKRARLGQVSAATGAPDRIKRARLGQVRAATGAPDKMIERSHTESGEVPICFPSQEVEPSDRLDPRPRKWRGPNLFPQSRSRAQR